MAVSTIEIEWGGTIEVPIDDTDTLTRIRNSVIAQSFALNQRGLLTPELASKAVAILDVTKLFIEDKKP